MGEASIESNWASLYDFFGGADVVDGLVDRSCDLRSVSGGLFLLANCDVFVEELVSASEEEISLVPE